MLMKILERLLSKLMKIDHISISRESVIEECEQKYKFRYHLGLVPDGPVPFYFTFGKIAHKIIETHTLAGGEKTIGKIKSDVLTGRIELEPGVKAPSLDNESHVRLSRHLNNYLRLADKIGYGGDVEWPFYCDIDFPNQRMLKGFIDRLIRKGDNFHIIDYKTTKPSRWRKDITNITKDLQLACYCWVVMTHFGVPAKNIKAALYYLDDAKLVPVTFGEATLNAVPKRLAGVFKRIEDTDPDRVVGNVGEHCRRCEYRKICPFYSLT